MSPNFWGCRCCGGSPSFVTHRVFSSSGDHIWSRLHTVPATGTFAGGSLPINGLMLGSDNEVVTTTSTDLATNKFQSIRWTIPDASSTNVLIDRVFASDWPDGHWHTDNGGGMFRAGFPSHIFYSSPLESDVWHSGLEAETPDDPVYGDYNAYVETLIDVTQDGSRVAAGYGEYYPTGGFFFGGVCSFSVDGTLEFQEGRMWVQYPSATYGLRRASPLFTEFDSNGKLYAFFNDSVFEFPDDSIKGSVWVFDTDGSLLYVLDPAVATGFGVKKKQNIFQDQYLFVGSGVSVRRHTLADCEMDLSFDVTSYGSEVSLTTCDQIGTVYAVVDRKILLAFDVDLNLIWEFRENGTLPIESACGLQCNGDYVSIGGSIKERDFDPSQLTVY